MIIKVLLIASVVAAALYLMRGQPSSRNLALRRTAGLAFAASWVIAVLAPDAVTRAANLVGVGRGTDLVLYLLVVAFLFTTLAQRQHVRELDRRITELTRALALREPLRPPDPHA